MFSSMLFDTAGQSSEDPDKNIYDALLHCKNKSKCLSTFKIRLIVFISNFSARDNSLVIHFLIFIKVVVPLADYLIYNILLML